MFNRFFTAEYFYFYFICSKDKVCFPAAEIKN